MSTTTRKRIALLAEADQHREVSRRARAAQNWHIAVTATHLALECERAASALHALQLSAPASADRKAVAR